MMIDPGIRPQTVEAARLFLRRAPNHSIAKHARALVAVADTHGAFADPVAALADSLYDELFALDMDGDGRISTAETDHSEECDELFQALRDNACEVDCGDLPASYKTSAPVAGHGFDLPNGQRAIVIALWSTRGAAWAFDKSIEMLKRVKPHGILLHTDPVALAGPAGAALTERVRATLPGIRVGWAFYGDSYGPNPSAIWRRCAAAAKRVGVDTLMPNCEVAWKNAKRGNFAARSEIAESCVRALVGAAGNTHLSFTSYDGPVNIVRPDGTGRWGGHEGLPWKAFLGAGLIHADVPQVYISGAAGPEGASRAQALNRFERAAKSRRAAVDRKMIAPGVEPWTYIQAHSSKPSAICALAERRRVTVAWASPSRIDERGIVGLQAAVELARRGETVASFQRSARLNADGDLGEKTIKALGL